MEQKKYAGQSRKATAITVLLVVLALLCAALVTVFSSASGRARKPKETEPRRDKTETSAPSDKSKTPSGQKKTPAALLPEDTVPAAEPIEEDPLPVSVTVVWTMPVEGGCAAKGFDAEALVYSQTMGDWRVHTGVDFSCALGADVEAAADGVIEKVWSDPFEGKCVSVRHENGYVSVYKNLAPELVPGIVEGNHVAGGQVIGSVGETCAVEIADEAHLHFEVTKDGERIDPLSVLPYDRSVVSYAE